MKKFKFIAASLLASGALLAGCSVSEVFSKISDTATDVFNKITGKEKEEEPTKCTHVDENHDHKCDLCGVEVSEHTDANKDHNCDVCGEKVSEHVDTDGDFNCDICDEGLPGIKTFEFKDNNAVLTTIGGTVDVSEQLLVDAVNGASDEVTWSVSNENAASIDESGVLTGLDSGKVTVTATSKFDSSKTATKEVVISFEEELFVNNGFEFVTEFPKEEIKEFFGSEYVFVPESAVTDLGMWVMSVKDIDQYADQMIIGFNIDSSERGSLLGNKILDDVAAYEGHYQFIKIDEYGSESDAYLSLDGKYVLEWSSIYKSDYTNLYLIFSYVETDAMFYGPELTNDVEWNANLAASMEESFSIQIPFTKLGQKYDYVFDSDTGEIILYDFSINHSPADNYAEVLLANGYTYNAMQDAYFKPIDEYESVFVKVYFSSFGNTFDIYRGATVRSEFPQELVDAYTESIGSANKVIPFATSGEEVNEYRLYVQEDENESFPYSDDSCEVRGLFFNYEDLAAYAKQYEDAGFELVSADYYEWQTQEHLTYYTFKKGALEVSIDCEPEYVFDWDTYEVSYFWDRCTLCVNAHHSDEFEETGIHFYSSSLSMTTKESGLQLSYALTGLDDEAVVLFESSDEEVATVDEDGYIFALAEGTTTITASVDGTAYSASIDVSVTVDESLSFADIIAYTRASYTEMGDYYSIIKDESIYADYGIGIEGGAWTMIIEDTGMYPYGDYGDDGLQYEMWDLAFYVPADMYADSIFAEMYMGNHYMYEGMTGCMCDVSVNSIELDIMIYADPQGSGSTIIRIDFWDWN